MAASGILLVFFAGLLSSVCHAQRNVFGSCPAVPPMEQFDIAKVGGLGKEGTKMELNIRVLLENFSLLWVKI